ncbi:MAG: PAS domain S-box protein, partial [Fidelibacterota bacterium]
AWIVLLDGEGNLTHSAQSGWGKKFQLLLQMIKKGEIPECGKKAMTKKEVVVSKGSVSCRNCPFHEFYPEYYNLTIALVSHGWTQGLMSVALPERTLVEEPELNLFRELAGDVAFGLRDLELEDQRRQMNTALQESEARFRVLSESAAEAIAIHDKGVILDVNSTYCQLFGYERKEVIGRSVLDFAAPESKDLVLKNVKRGYQKPYEAVGLRKDGSTFIGELIGKPIPYIGRTVRATIIRDITERKQLEKILEQIVGGTSTAIGEDFFRSLISSMARSMKTDIVFITRLDRANPQLVRTLALWQKGRIRKNIAWEVADTPCEKVIKGQTVVVKKGVQGKFPRDAMLKEVKAESYLAVPILDMEGAVIGHLGVLDRRPMEYPQRFENIVRIFALRAGTELQRLQVEEELESIFASSPLPVMIVDEQRVIQRTNEAAEQYCQQIASELVGQRTGEVLLCIHRLDDPRGCGFGPDCKTCLTRNTILDTFQDHQTRQGVESEMSLLVKGQTAQRTIRLNTSYFESFAGPRVMVVFDDITEHKQIQTEVLRLKEFNEQIVTGMTEGIVVMDAGGIMEYINPAAEKMLGYSQTEMEGKHWSLIIPEDQHPIVNAVDERRKQGESSVYDLQLVRKDGQRLDVRVSGSPRFQNSEFVGTMAVFTDITEQKRTDKALRESEEKFKSIFESFIDVYYRQDKDRLITMVSPSIRQFGYKPEDIIGTRGRDYYYDQADREELVALLEKEGIIKDYRVKLRDARGNPVWTSANLRMLRDLKGNFAGIEGILRD